MDPSRGPGASRLFVKLGFRVASVTLSILFLSVTCCGGVSQATADSDAFTGATRTMVTVETMCSDLTADDLCTPPRIRALTRSARCLTSDRLEARGLPIPDGGSPCHAP